MKIIKKYNASNDAVKPLEIIRHFIELEFDKIDNTNEAMPMKAPREISGGEVA